jgi:hypothetical protein
LASYVQEVLAIVRNKHLRDQIRQEFENAKKLKWRVVSESDSFFDVETGILVFRKFEKKIFQGDDVDPLSFESALTHVTA